MDECRARDYAEVQEKHNDAFRTIRCWYDDVPCKFSLSFLQGMVQFFFSLMKSVNNPGELYYC